MTKPDFMNHFNSFLAIKNSLEIHLKIWNQIETEFELVMRLQFACASVVYVYVLFTQSCPDSATP